MCVCLHCVTLAVLRVASAVVTLSMCMLYLYCISDCAGHCKFGYSSDPQHRLRVLQTGNGQSLRLVDCIAVESDLCVRDLERQLHSEFAHRRVRGEWFRCSESEGVAFLRWFEIHYLN